jgi:hypothetical protein
MEKTILIGQFGFFVDCMYLLYGVEFPELVVDSIRGSLHESSEVNLFVFTVGKIGRACIIIRLKMV